MREPRPCRDGVVPTQAMAEKASAEAAVAKGMQKLDLAQRLTSALASENERWKESVAQMEIDRNLLTGDVLLASAFISKPGNSAGGNSGRGTPAPAKEPDSAAAARPRGPP